MPFSWVWIYQIYSWPYALASLLLETFSLRRSQAALMVNYTHFVKFKAPVFVCFMGVWTWVVTPDDRMASDPSTTDISVTGSISGYYGPFGTSLSLSRTLVATDARSLLTPCGGFREFAKQWSPKDGVWFPHWMRYQIFAPLLALKFLNVFWYFLILRIAFR